MHHFDLLETKTAHLVGFYHPQTASLTPCAKNTQLLIGNDRDTNALH